jgi:large subunit ribosomal protein L21
MKYAIIKTGGKQYKVSEGDVLEVDRLKAEKDGKVIFDEVLLLVSDEGMKVGKPFLPGGKVEAKVIDNIKGDKIRVSKFKSKVRYRKTMGFRASLSKVMIEKIGGTKEEKAAGKKS